VYPVGSIRTAYRLLSFKVFADERSFLREYGKATERNVLQIFGRNVLTSSSMCANFSLSQTGNEGSTFTRQVFIRIPSQAMSCPKTMEP